MNRVTNQGYVKIRRGIVEHLAAGTLNVTEFAVLQLLILMADSATGSGTINAVVLRGCYFPEMPQDTAQRTLLSLETKGFLFRLNPANARLAYRYWIAKYEATTGPHRMRRSDLSQVSRSKDIADLRWVEGPTEIEAVTPAVVQTVVPAVVQTVVRTVIPNSYKKKEIKKQKPSASVFKNVMKEKSPPAPISKTSLTNSSTAAPAPKKPPRVRPKTLPSDERLLIIFRAYPRQAVVGRALAALKIAVGTISARDHCTRDQACDWLQERVAAYTAKKAGTDPQYIPYLSTWLKDLGYDEAALAPRPKIEWEDCSWEDCKTPEYQAAQTKWCTELGWGQL
jgi:cell division protein FtsN